LWGQAFTEVRLNGGKILKFFENSQGCPIFENNEKPN